MKPNKPTGKPSVRLRKLAELQVREYIDRYHPEMAGSTVEISPDGRFARVLTDSRANSVADKGKRKQPKNNR
jgi:hypothetical protein